MTDEKPGMVERTDVAIGIGILVLSGFLVGFGLGLLVGLLVW